MQFLIPIILFALGSIATSTSLTTCSKAAASTSTCSIACGVNYIDCGPSGCYNPSIGEICCNNTCPQGSFCAPETGSCTTSGGGGYASSYGGYGSYSVYGTSVAKTSLHSSPGINGTAATITNASFTANPSTTTTSTFPHNTNVTSSILISSSEGTSKTSIASSEIKSTTVTPTTTEATNSGQPTQTGNIGGGGTVSAAHVIKAIGNDMMFIVWALVMSTMGSLVWWI